jgi:hypothetical protein
METFKWIYLLKCHSCICSFYYHLFYNINYIIAKTFSPPCRHWGRNEMAFSFSYKWVRIKSSFHPRVKKTSLCHTHGEINTCVCVYVNDAKMEKLSLCYALRLSIIINFPILLKKLDLPSFLILSLCYSYSPFFTDVFSRI